MTMHSGETGRLSEDAVVGLLVKQRISVPSTFHVHYADNPLLNRLTRPNWQSPGAWTALMGKGGAGN